MKKLNIFLGLLFATISGFAQYNVQPTSSGILLKMKKLNVLGSVLYLAAHPDDENTRLIGYLSNEMLVNAGYLALTRGDGGQNLIGPELREGLGLIRTQELLAARRVDGSEQFFSRANDFGYSKTAKETLKIWDEDQVLHDVVWTIRKFRPDVIITRFPPDARAGHGHHTTSAIMAEKAFDNAATNEYPDQLSLVAPWQPTRLMINSGRWWDENIESKEGTVKIDVGVFNALLGESNTEAAARSRSMHKSQGFGGAGSRGESMEYLTVIKGEPTTTSILDGIDISWARVGRPDITQIVNNIIKNYDLEKPYKSVDGLLALYKEVEKVNDKFWKAKKLSEIETLIFDCSGMFVSAWASDYAVVTGDDVEYSLEVVNRSPVKWQLESMAYQHQDSAVNKLLEQNQQLVIKSKIQNPTIPVSGPYWLEKPATLGMYTVDDLELIGLAENPPPFTIDLEFTVDGIKLSHKVPLIYHWSDRVKGEMFRPLTVVPPAFLNLSSPVYLFDNGEQKSVTVEVTASTAKLLGELKLQVPEGWSTSPTSVEVNLAEKWQRKSFEFVVKPLGDIKSGAISAIIKVGTNDYNRSIYNIEYDHIPYQIMLPLATSRAENMDVQHTAQTVGYVVGAGDNVPESLEQIGVKVWIMGESDITTENLGQLDALVFGIRAANTLDWLPSKKPIIEEYMANGGTVIMQYNTTRGIKWQDFAPYELTFTGGSSDSRVAEESAAITILEPNHQVLNYPNKINQSDFGGWVQERGLYFPATWDEHYSAILSAHDEDEDPKSGGLLIADYGKGHFVYTGYSWFRELPAGVPGAYRLFANILSLSSQLHSDSLPLEKSKKKKEVHNR